MKPVRLVDELRRTVGLFVSLALAVAWAIRAAGDPQSTVLPAPLLVAGVWVAVDGSIGAGLTQRRIVNEALGGFGIAVATIAILALKGDLAGPTPWSEGGMVHVVVALVGAAVVGAIAGALCALRVASRPPRVE